MMRPAQSARCGIVWIAATLGALAVVDPALVACKQAYRAIQSGAIATQSLETLLVWLCAPIAVAGITWLWTSATLIVGCAARGRICEITWCPPALQRIVLVACGVALMTPTALSAHALEQPGRPGNPAANSIAGLPLPDRAAAPELTSTQRDGLRLPGSTAGSIPGSVTHSATNSVDARLAQRLPRIQPSRWSVKPGETLWHIAQVTLPSKASPAAIADYTQRLYAENRQVIGADPNLIYPGQHLDLPTTQEKSS